MLDGCELKLIAMMSIKRIYTKRHTRRVHSELLLIDTAYILKQSHLVGVHDK